MIPTDRPRRTYLALARLVNACHDADNPGDMGVGVTDDVYVAALEQLNPCDRPENRKVCCICSRPTPEIDGGEISTGDINAPVKKFCCNECFHNMVCP